MCKVARLVYTQKIDDVSDNKLEKDSASKSVDIELLASKLVDKINSSTSKVTSKLSSVTTAVAEVTKITKGTESRLEGVKKLKT